MSEFFTDDELAAVDGLPASADEFRLMADSIMRSPGATAARQEFEAMEAAQRAIGVQMLTERLEAEAGTLGGEIRDQVKALADAEDLYDRAVSSGIQKPEEAAEFALRHAALAATGKRTYGDIVEKYEGIDRGFRPSPRRDTAGPRREE